MPLPLISIYLCYWQSRDPSEETAASLCLTATQTFAGSNGTLLFVGNVKCAVFNGHVEQRSIQVLSDHVVLFLSSVTSSYQCCSYRTEI